MNRTLTFALLLLARIVEVIILYLLVNWIWQTFEPLYKIALMVAVFITYGIYFFVTLADDYHDYKYGEGEIGID